MNRKPKPLTDHEIEQRKAEAAVDIWERFAQFDELMDTAEFIQSLPVIVEPPPNPPASPPNNP